MKQGRGAATVLINYLDVAEKKKGEVKLLSFVSISFDFNPSSTPKGLSRAECRTGQMEEEARRRRCGSRPGPRSRSARLRRPYTRSVRRNREGPLALSRFPVRYFDFFRFFPKFKKILFSLRKKVEYLHAKKRAYIFC